jgi:hypothetical protein
VEAGDKLADYRAGLTGGDGAGGICGVDVDLGKAAIELLLS